MDEYKTPAPPSSSATPVSRDFSALRFVGIISTVLLIASSTLARTNITETRHYRIHSDLDSAIVRDYGKRLDAMYDEYARRLADFESPSRQKFEVHLFGKKSDYARFTGNRVPNSAGIFIPAQRALAGFEEGQGRSGLRQTLQHEAFHQFAWEAISPNLPIWLDEGLAQIFEEGVWTGNQFILGQVPPRRIADLHDDMRSGRFTGFAKFMSMTREQFQSRMKDPKLGRAQYNQAWAMTHFLIFAEGEDKAPKYRARLLAWLRDMHNGRDPQEAFVDNFSGNFEGFEKRFGEWAQTLAPTPMAVYGDRMNKLAELLRLFKEDGQEFDSIDDLRKHLTKGRFHLTEQRDGQTYTHEENALTYLSDLSDTPWPADRLLLQSRRGVLPDIVLRPPGQAQIRVRFYKNADQINYDLAFEMR
jgi:hypothetical protein